MAGRPSKYKPEFVGQAAKLCSLGATDAQLSDFFEVSISTIALWKVQHREFSDALKAPKLEADERVEQSLYRRALGYEHDEVDIRVVDHQIVKTPIRKYYPPDTTAAIFWLKNRRPAEWRDAVEVIKRNASDKTDAELEAIAFGRKQDKQTGKVAKKPGQYPH